MMENSDKTEEYIDKTMASLVKIERATPRPFFYTRLEAKLQQRYAPMPKFVLRPAFIWSFLTLIVVLNVSIVFHYSKKGESSKEQNASSFAQEYGLNSLDTNL
jgi:hypothetical protein